MYIKENPSFAECSMFIFKQPPVFPCAMAAVARASWQLVPSSCETAQIAMGQLITVGADVKPKCVVNCMEFHGNSKLALLESSWCLGDSSIERAGGPNFLGPSTFLMWTNWIEMDLGDDGAPP